jgi:hypothetical protein
MSRMSTWQMPQWGRRLVLVGAVVAIVLGIAEVITGGTLGGAFLLIVGSVTLSGVLRQMRPQWLGVDAVNSYHMVKAYAFFALCSVGGAAVFVLAVLGVLRNPALFAVLGLAASGIGTYVVVTEFRTLRRNVKGSP